MGGLFKAGLLFPEVGGGSVLQMGGSWRHMGGFGSTGESFLNFYNFIFRSIIKYITRSSNLQFHSDPSFPSKYKCPRKT